MICASARPLLANLALSLVAPLALAAGVRNGSPSAPSRYFVWPELLATPGADDDVCLRRTGSRRQR